MSNKDQKRTSSQLKPTCFQLTWYWLLEKVTDLSIETGRVGAPTHHHGGVFSFIPVSAMFLPAAFCWNQHIHYFYWTLLHRVHVVSCLWTKWHIKSIKPTKDMKSKNEWKQSQFKLKMFVIDFVVDHVAIPLRVIKSGKYENISFIKVFLYPKM